VEIIFTNHASFVVQTNDITIMSDPWLYGSAFNDGWDLICESKFKSIDFAKIDYIWFSHEHPDHFSPQVLIDIDSKIRKDITILYKDTKDEKVISYCKKLGFRCISLSDGKKVTLKNNVRVICCPVPFSDSWLIVENGLRRILNLNDAVVETKSELNKIIKKHGDIDVLLTQFSYAAWRGNKNDTLLRQKDSERKLRILSNQIKYIKPTYVIPFASFSFFSHIENDYMNDAVNKPWDVINFIEKSDTKGVLMYPSDRWRIGDPINNDRAKALYYNDYKKIPEKLRRTSSQVSFTDLQKSANFYIERVEKVNSPYLMWLLRKNPCYPILRPIHIFIWDINQHVRFSFSDGLTINESKYSPYQLSMSSDSLNFLLSHTWGLNTLTINGRFEADTQGLRMLLTTFSLEYLNNAGISLSLKFFFEFRKIMFMLKIFFKKLRDMKKYQDNRALGNS
jgi:hypothetical protein